MPYFDVPRLLIVLVLLGLLFVFEAQLVAFVLAFPSAPSASDQQTGYMCAGISTIIAACIALYRLRR